MGVVALGGTIASTQHANGAGVSPGLEASDLVGSVPELAEVAVVEPEGLVTKPSGDLEFSDISLLYDRLTSLVERGCDAVVVTQGTDTLEETSYALDLLWARDEPVVFTGAMRNPLRTGSDGPANLLAAVQVGAWPATRGRGVLVVMNDEVHAARFASKVHTSSLSAFSSAPNGPIGSVSEGRPYFTVELARSEPLEVPDEWDDSVELVVATLGGGARILEGLASTRPSGLVIAGFGGGHVPRHLVPVIEDLVAFAPVVLASRVEAGRTLESTYGFPGGEIDLLSRGLLAAGGLGALKARILLSTLLSSGASREAVERSFRCCVQRYDGSGAVDVHR